MIGERSCASTRLSEHEATWRRKEGV